MRSVFINFFSLTWPQEKTKIEPGTIINYYFHTHFSKWWGSSTSRPMFPACLGALVGDLWSGGGFTQHLTGRKTTPLGTLVIQRSKNCVSFRQFSPRLFEHFEFLHHFSTKITQKLCICWLTVGYVRTDGYFVVVSLESHLAWEWCGKREFVGACVIVRRNLVFFSHCQPEKIVLIPRIGLREHLTTIIIIILLPWLLWFSKSFFLASGKHTKNYGTSPFFHR